MVMVASSSPKGFSPSEYLAWEKQQQTRHEFIDGEIVAMTGGSIAHTLIYLNLYTALRSHLKPRGCLVCTSDVKCQISDQGPYFYPDLLVSCDERDKKASNIIQFPTLIVEVLSPSTEAYDRGKKFGWFRQLSSLQEYVVIESEGIGVECFRRRDENLWVLEAYREGDTVTFESLEFQCAIADIYEDIEFQESIDRL